MHIESNAMNRIIFNEHMNFHLITSHRFNRTWTCSSFFENKFHSINLVHCESEIEGERRDEGEWRSSSKPSQTHLLLFPVFVCNKWKYICGECEKMNQSPIDPFPTTYFIKYIWFNLSCCAWISFNFSHLQRESFEGEDANFFNSVLVAMDTF